MHLRLQFRMRTLTLLNSSRRVTGSITPEQQWHPPLQAAMRKALRDRSELF